MKGFGMTMPDLPLGYNWHVEPKGTSTYIAVVKPGGTHPIAVWDHTFNHAPDICKGRYLEMLLNAAKYLHGIAWGLVSQHEWMREVVLDGRHLD